MRNLVVVVVLVLLKSAHCQDSCRNKETCGACIQEIGCHWCSEEDFSGKSHCKNDAEIQHCPTNNVISPISKFVPTSNFPIQLKSDSPLVQMTPQEINLRLRKGEEYELKFQYGHAPNYPIDLYYLMDLSASMKEHKHNLANLGGKLIETMKEITADFQIGFGSFVDKTDMPFISTVPSKLLNPCQQSCVPAYSFKNHQSLNDGKSFSEQVRNAKESGNLDTPEGGFDALMQTMVCKEEIGWRDKARHLIVFSTDAAFHVAGDGKLAGVVEPNDNKCHMKNHEYTHALTYDYPSISHINHIAKENNFNIFFAIAEKGNAYTLYQRLKDEVESSGIAPLKTNSNLTHLIVDYYNKISSTANVRDNAETNVQIKYECTNQDGSICGSLHSGDIVNYSAKIKFLDCSRNTRQKITISTDTLRVGMVINLEAICDCDCEKETSQGDEKCKNNGGLQCGICDCKKGFYGKNCECDGQHDYGSDFSLCMNVNANDTTLCSGQGTCKCGTCECDKRVDQSQEIYGKFCECDNYSCLKTQGSKICDGNGRCDCGKCVCNAGWSGESCNCRDNFEDCQQNEQICNGKGTCQCGECKCEMGYYGRFCEECATCSGGRCDELRPCVECDVHGTGVYKEECDVRCAQYSIMTVDEIGDVDSEDYKVCRYETENNCKIVFKYYYADSDIKIEARKTLQCPAAIIFELVFGLIGSILLAGIIALVIWKLYTHIHDKREYAKFENEKAKSRWNTDNNPLYKSATTKFENPTYKS